MSSDPPPSHKKHKKTHKSKTTTHPSESEPIKATIEVISRQKNKSEPIIGYFPSGYDPVTASTETASSPSVTLLKHKEKRRIELVVKPKDSEVEFVGKSHAGEGANPQRCVFALGVFDKDKSVLKIVNIAGDKIIRLDPRVPEPERDGEVSNQLVLAEDAIVQTKAQQIKKLNQTFGTKASNKIAEKLEAVYQKPGDEAAKELDEKVKVLKVNKKALQHNGTVVNNLGIPHYNIDATEPHEAYPLDKIILEGEWDHLLDIHELVQAGNALDQSAYPSFVCNRVHKLKEIKDNGERMKMACLFSYITHLIKFKDQHSIEFSSAKNHRIPSILKQKFSTMFSTNEMRTLAQENSNLLISYVLVLSLFIDNFRTNIDDIANDLRMSSYVLRNHVFKLGCKFVTENKVPFATLPIPLKFPDGDRKRKNSKR